MVNLLLRYLQGERRGLGSQLPAPTPAQRLITGNFLYIVIPLLVRLADVSFYQGSIDFLKMKSMGIKGVIIRAGQRTWPDVRFLVNWLMAKASGLPRGSYFFYDSRETPQKQAALWWSMIRDDVGELFHVADIEESYGGPYGSKAHFKTFILEFQRLSGLPDSKIVIYTGYYWWRDRVGNDIFFKRFRLWLAWYSAMEVVQVPLPWEEVDLILWQNQSNADGWAYGVESREIDLNWFNGNEEEFNRIAGIGGSMIWYRATGNISMRTGAGTSFPNAQINGVNQYVLTGDYIETSQQVGGFVMISRLYRNGAFIDLPTVAWCGMAYLANSAAPVPATPSIFVTHDFTDTLTFEGKEYNAHFTVENVEYKPKTP